MSTILSVDEMATPVFVSGTIFSTLSILNLFKYGRKGGRISLILRCVTNYLLFLLQNLINLFEIHADALLENAH